MESAEILGTLKSFIEAEFPNQGLGLDESTHLLEEWFVDSFGIMETVLFMESTFGIDVSRADINAANFASLTALTQFVAGRLQS